MKVACPTCSKEREYKPSVALKLATKLCKDCLSKEGKSKWVTKTCLHCGREKSIPPGAVLRHADTCRNCPKYKPGRTLPDTYDGGYVLGTILGDGCLFKGKCGNGIGYGLKLDVTSEAFARKFALHLESVIERRPWFFSKVRTMKANPSIKMPETVITCFITGVWSREWYDILSVFEKERKFSGILDYSEDFRRGFLQGIIDSEGYLNPDYVDVANKDLLLLQSIDSVAKSLGYKSRINGPYPYSRGVAHLRLPPLFQKTV